MPVEIRETTITPDADGDTIQLRISDAPLGDESASFQLTILATLPPLQTAALAQLQREAMKIAQDALTPILKNLASQLQKSGFGLEPRRVGRTV
jgi:hypothetical protein